MVKENGEDVEEEEERKIVHIKYNNKIYTKIN
jgi:hypothetical protein